MIHGAFFFASSNKSLTLDAPTPTNISTKSEPLIIKNGTPASPATALARSVLPVPGCPTSKTPFGILAPMSVNFFGFFKNSTISSNSSFSSSTPATSLKVTFALSCGVTILALLFPNVMVLLPPFWLPFIIKNQKIRKIIKIPNGVSKLRITIKKDSDLSETSIVPAFIDSFTVSIKLSILGIFTSFGTLSFFIVTSAVVPLESITISSTSPASMLATSSEYANLLLELSKIELTNTIKIINIISHMASVLIPFFKFFPPYFLIKNFSFITL